MALEESLCIVSVVINDTSMGWGVKDLPSIAIC